MPNINSDEIITSKHKRNYIQFGGPRPGNPVLYSGQDAQYLIIEGVSNPETGAIKPLYVPDPRRQGFYRLVGRSIVAPDLPKASLLMKEKHGAIPSQLARIGVQFNLYELTGACADLSDFISGWTDYILIYSLALVTNKDLGKRTAWDADDPMEDKMELILSEIYPIGSMSFGTDAATQVDREVIDIVYGSRGSSGDCGPQDDGTQHIYAVTKSSGAGSPGLPAEIVYSLDGGATWNQANIDGFGATEDPLHIMVAGIYIIVIGSGAYYYSLINQNTGVPGTFTKVTAGFVTGKAPLDGYVANPREVYFSGQGGYVYKLTQVGAAVSVVTDGSVISANALRINGDKNDTIVAAGVGGATMKSTNRGKTWFSTTTTAVGVGTDITAVFVLDKLRYWVGTSKGHLFYTIDGGETWVQSSFSGANSGQVHDITFANNEVGFLSHSTATPTARIFTTWDGGKNWTNVAPRILNLPTFNKAGQINVPDVTDSGITANNLAVAGLAGDGVDGIILIGIAGKV